MPNEIEDPDAWMDQLTPEELEIVEMNGGAFPGDLDMTFEEMALLAAVELIEKQTGKSAFSKYDPNSPQPKIPQWFLDACCNF